MTVGEGEVYGETMTVDEGETMTRVTVDDEDD